MCRTESSNSCLLDARAVAAHLARERSRAARIAATLANCQTFLNHRQALTLLVMFDFRKEWLYGRNIVDASKDAVGDKTVFTILGQLGQMGLVVYATDEPSDFSHDPRDDRVYKLTKEGHATARAARRLCVCLQQAGAAHQRLRAQFEGE